MISRAFCVLTILALVPGIFWFQAKPANAQTVPSNGLRGKVLCGYQGWFRCPKDAANLGWVHWSRNGNRIAPDTLSFELWPDMRDYGPDECFPALGFTYPDGRQAELFSSDNAKTVLRHFQWMKKYGIDGVWLQHFLVDLPGGPEQARYETRMSVLKHVRRSAHKTGRVWAISYDVAGSTHERIYEALTTDWRKMVDDGVTKDSRYVHVGGRPVVQIWGFYHDNDHNRMTADLANKLIHFFHDKGRYSAYLVGGGDWNWRNNSDPAWQQFLRQLDAYVPWNVGNYLTDGQGVRTANTQYWAADKEECERHGVLWIPSVYPGFSWDNLTRQKPGSSLIPRRRGQFLWEQFHALARLGGDSVYVAMFDEVDEGTAIFKVTSEPPTQGHFVGYEGLPSDWYLRLVGEGARMLRGQRPISAEIAIRP